MWFVGLVKSSKRNFSKNQNEGDPHEHQRSNPQILESIGYLKPHDQNLDPNVEMRVHLNDQILVMNNDGACEK